MQGDFTFGNFDQVDHRDSFEPIPGAEYDFRILTPELVPTRAGDGQIVNIKLQVHGGQLDGRIVFARFNVANPNPTAVEIALKQIKQMSMSAGMNATGEITWSMIQQLEGRLCRALIYIKKDMEHGDKNEIRRFIVPDTNQVNSNQNMNQNNNGMNQNNSNMNQQQNNMNQNSNDSYQNNNNVNQPQSNSSGRPWQQS